MAKLLAFDRDRDSRLLKAAEPLGPPVKVPKTTRVDTEVTMFGFPGGSPKMHVTTGTGRGIEQQPSYLVHQRIQRETENALAGIFNKDHVPVASVDLLAQGPFKETVPMAVLDLPSFGGYSGSGIFRSADGQLVGIIARGSNNAVSVATPVSTMT